ncbi:50S ribosomal protein L35 [candidate division WOR-1 bacterium RIFCSPLOWO2_02_FULL_46_20]|uniref:Large ribosomal subunit protein bL35 n=2 Tax=Saganbacteria TaxID=1703751 RepID=A0A1F4R4R6_UNCSA|nr:MAG: 50S ribosomal protein L35 [candidate division WOR-1 bacterium RIFCSPHIGHO2_02_FULL_45_12]OGC03110.1 MAG: 50S ribosomal protein L35 [candidate division WOR-1 bacterium RIFCSPLOWO2_02_FULL_46_20]OGC08077.1 MAG: 50S ribosomal protein L35 [candidate division WOR-1 bacterium RIFCSPLOWO2_12_FULL_45_9]
MPKMKTRRAAAKRFRITKNGKILRRQTKMRHLLECKAKKKKRSKRRVCAVAKSDYARVKSMLAGGQ